jgi:ketosteroid isomerase-like protein
MADLIAYIKNEFDATWNTNDAEAVLAHFTDDAVVCPVPPLPGAPEVFRGEDEVRGFVQMLIPNFHVESRDYRARGDTVSWYATVTSDTVRQMGVDSLSADCEAIVRDGKVVSFTPRFTQETLERLQAATQVVGL